MDATTLYRMVAVDDEEYILDGLKEIFDWAALGFEIVQTFNSVEPALDYIRSQKEAKTPVDVLFTDIRLGSDSGLRLATEARELSGDIEIIFLSAHSDFDYARTAIRINVFDYLLKPVTYESIVSCFGELKKRLDRKYKATGRAGNENYHIQLVKRFIDQHISENISLETAAEYINMNPTYFSCFFKQHTQKAFIVYLTERRMEKAIELLRDPQKKAYEICGMVGYYSRQHFYKVFRQHTGRTPIVYRNEVLRIPDDDKEE